MGFHPAAAAGSERTMARHCAGLLATLGAIPRDKHAVHLPPIKVVQRCRKCPRAAMSIEKERPGPHGRSLLCPAIAPRDRRLAMGAP